MSNLATLQPRRRKCAAATRAAILDAARARFLEESYNSVGLRDIARDAGVDVALVNRYFGSKEELFTLVMRGGEGESIELPQAGDSLADFFTALVSREDEQGCVHTREKLQIMLRSANSPAAAAVISAAFRKGVLDPLADLLPGRNANARAALMMAVLIGTNVLRNVFPVTPLPAEEEAAFEAGLRGLFELAQAPVEAQA